MSLTLERLRAPSGLAMGATAQRYGVTPRALRLYEERGLLAPPRNALNVRFYDASTRERIAWIVRLRRLDFALAEIGEILTKRDAGERIEELIRERVLARQEMWRRRIADGDALLRDFADGLGGGSRRAAGG